MLAGLKAAGLGVQIGAALGGATALVIAATFFVSKIDHVYDNGYEAGTTAHALADAKAAQEAQEVLDARVAEVEAEHKRRIQELENDLADTRRRAAAAASSERAAFNAELVRLRNELRARRNASRTEDPGPSAGEVPSDSAD